MSPVSLGMVKVIYIKVNIDVTRYKQGNNLIAKVFQTHLTYKIVVPEKDLMVMLFTSIK